MFNQNKKTREMSVIHEHSLFNQITGWNFSNHNDL